MKQHNSIFRDSFIRDKIKNNFDMTSEELASKKEIIRPWIERIESGRILEKNEEQMQSEFITLVFEKLLGYVDNLQNNEEWNIETEKKTDLDGKKPDGTFGYFYRDSSKDLVKAVLELKDAHHKDLDRRQNRKDDKRTPVEQGFDYAPKYKKGRAKWVLISNFNEIRLYSSDNMSEYERFYIEHLLDEEELKRFLYLLSTDHILENKLESLVELNIKAEAAIEKKFYADYKKTRFEIIEEVIKENPTSSRELVIEKTQKLLDRFLFIAFCEDKHFIPANIFKQMLAQANALMTKSMVFTSLCNAINTGNKDLGINKFNGGLFANDDDLNSLSIPNSVFDKLEVIAEYDFSTELDENILGHIFEQSLNDLEELKAEYSGENFDKTKSKRKKDGVFYTPKHITRKIVETSIQNYIEDKKVKLGYYSLDELTEKDYEIKQTGKNKEKLTLNAERHLTYLRKLRKEIMNVKIVDPACGSGAFLITAFDVLMEEMNKINMQIQDLGKNQQSFFDSLDSDDELYSSAYDNEILKNCLYGVDLNKESVEITRLSLWLRTLSKDKPLTNLDKNIKVGNSLIDDPEIAGDLAFDWEKEFPEIFEQGGFDIVVGNPPYVSTKQIPEKDREYYWSKFKDILYSEMDLYQIFIYKCLNELLKNNGILSFITPNSYFTNASFELLRKYILENYKINEIIEFPYRFFPFTEVNTETAIIILEKDKIKTNNYVDFKVSKKVLGDLSIQEAFISNNTILQDDIINKYQNKIIININNIIDKVLFSTNTFKDYLELHKGWMSVPKKVKVDTLELNKGIFTKKEVLDLDIEKYCTPYLEGRDIHRYFIDNVDKFVYSQDMDEKTKSWHFDKKIILQRIVGQNKNKIFATVDFNNTIIFPNANLVNIINTTDDIRFYLAILNSKLISYFYNLYFGESNTNLTKQAFESIPIPDVSNLDKTPFINLVNTMLNLNEEFRTETNKFQRLFTRKFSLEKVSKKLSTWYDLDFKDFVKELKKAKVKLSLSDEMEWEEVFENKKEEVIKLKSEIEKTDAQIDDLVYKLYELTPEEIEIIKEG